MWRSLGSVRGNRGYAALAVLLAAALMLMVGAALLRNIYSEAALLKNHEEWVTAYYLAEAGLYRTLGTLQRDPDFGADQSWRSFSLGGGSYRVKVIPDSQDTVKINLQGIYGKAKVDLTATAFIERPADPDAGKAQVILVDFQGVALP